ncbi:hydrogen peroxide-inducible genes activator [Acuticoccus mangrovi]|uniref:LysR family transcriptional regulator n=1 Tax=Acuticoccus mangrovi TaxID=2796142 RepID=A0A934ICT1_9HYPH|nr:hydrogen peroxide-inducible genes activator [Acuticoccus mangrovi]MBJ3774183.1 LysR family transcriptional regulator [Acuticoccus mangrovi]
MINLNIRHLYYFIILVESGSFSKAAAHIGIGQSTLSGAIQGLEATIGGPLLDRTGRELVLLPLGEAVLRRARDIMAQIGELPDLAARSARPLSSRLRLGLIPSIAPFLLPRMLKSLKRAFPELDLYVREGMTHTLLSEVRTGRLDVALIADINGAEDFDIAEIGRDPLLLVVPTDHPLAGRNAAGPEDIEGEQLLLLDKGHCLRQHVLTAVGADHVTEAAAVSAFTIPTLMHMVEAHIGITLIPEVAVRAGAASQSDVRTVRFDSPHAWRTLGLASRPRAARSADFDALAEHLRAEGLIGIGPQ